MAKKGTLVIIDGIDGCGKGTLVQALAHWSRRRGKRVFDLRQYGLRYHRLPEPEELKRYDVIISAEPTFSLIGRAIRDEIVRNNRRDYSALATAQAYSLDRMVLYRRVIIPALQMGKTIFQERGFSTSICYQPIQKEPLPIKKILQLEGNQLTAKYRPDLLMIVRVSPAEAMRRLRLRTGKRDHHIFERLAFLEKAERRFEAGWYRKLFQRFGSQVAYVDTDIDKRESIRQAVTIWEKFLAGTQR